MRIASSYVISQAVHAMRHVCQRSARSAVYEESQEVQGVFIRWNGAVEWNGGMERWDGIVEWNGGIVE